MDGIDYSQYLIDIDGSLNDIRGDIQSLKDDLSFNYDYLEYQREQIFVNNSISLAILVFVGACLGALIFRHLRK